MKTEASQLKGPKRGFGKGKGKTESDIIILYSPQIKKKFKIPQSKV